MDFVEYMKMKIFGLKNRRIIFSIIILITAAGWVAGSALFAEDTTQGVVPASRPGFLAPDFQLMDINQQSYRLQDFRGKAVIVNLWASWCPPCKAEMPAIESVFQAYASQGLVILGVNMTTQDDLNTVRAFVQENRITFPILLDTEGMVARLYGMRALPTTIFIGKDGVIQDIVVGGPLSEAQLKAEAIDLLGEVR